MLLFIALGEQMYGISQGFVYDHEITRTILHSCHNAVYFFSNLWFNNTKS